MNPVDQPKGKTLSVGAGCKHRIAVSLTLSSLVGVECKEYELFPPPQSLKQCGNAMCCGLYSPMEGYLRRFLSIDHLDPKLFQKQKNSKHLQYSHSIHRRIFI